jgi:hypothetical protein
MCAQAASFEPIPPATDGVLEWDFESWVDLSSALIQLLPDDRFRSNSYVWRGQRRDDWLLEPRLDRDLQKLSKGLDLRHVPEVRERHLQGFKWAALGRRGPNPLPINEENHWWALGAHHGLSTPLLDWTESPYIAAFFAFEQAGEHDQTDHRVVWALSKHITQKEWKSKDYSGNGSPPAVLFLKPFRDDNARILDQQGLFTRAPDGEDLESWVKKTFPGRSDAVLIKIRIPNSDRCSCLTQLGALNINRLRLFPDVGGAAEGSNLDLELNLT